ncbi:glycosyl hydrolase [Jiulongibacter sp. NS-SX5]|uniref:glycosyl hydrolase n=1 Tax=Jiulongibacter sp. NS-SX5 TaxID=3463854 RepID=UPI0040595FFB
MKIKLLSLAFCLSIAACAQQKELNTKPFTRWWWMGSAVNEAGIKYNLEQFAKAGLGGVEITPIYGVKGEDENFLPFLSDKYLKKLNYTTHIADSLGLKVDMVLGTGWPYGGPQVESEHAATKLRHELLEVSKSQTIDHAIETPSFEPLVAAIAVNHTGETINIEKQIVNNRLKWESSIDGKIYLFFAGKTGQKVKRAAPGGEGFTVDHYSKNALEDYLKPYSEKLNAPIRAIFNDSYEVYSTDFTPDFLQQFETKRGYSIKPYLPALVEKTDSETINRVRADYRRTLSDLLKEEFNETWTRWSNKKGFQTKLQAHGSPGNLLDLYATADIPECETFGSMPFDIPGFRREAEDIREGDADPVMLKFSSSAAHVMGRPLVSSESFTWLRDHFKTAVSQCKPELEELLLNGINHVFLHGSTYSPPTAEWPGWKFYASVNFSPQMTIWKDAPALFNYIENCQKYLRKGVPDNEIGVYWPIEDTYHDFLKGQLFFQFKIHSLDEWLLNTPFYRTNQLLIKSGYQVDFFSDDFISQAKVNNGLLVLPGGSYKALVIPETKHMPLETMQKLVALKREGANIIFESTPQTVPGNFDLESRELALEKLGRQIETTNSENLIEKLREESITPEALRSYDLKFIRRKDDDKFIYYIVNHTANDFDDWVSLNELRSSAIFVNPNTGNKSLATSKGIKLYLQLKAGESIIIETNTKEHFQGHQYLKEQNVSYNIEGPYELEFLEGGPTLPQPTMLPELNSWTELGSEAENFSGTAKYTVRFDSPNSDVKNWLLQLPDVRESAKIYLNGKEVAWLWANPFEVVLSGLKSKGNLLEIEVTNLAANRIRAKEMRGEEWKNFYEINMVNKDYQKFDATLWKPMPSGLIGDVSLLPLDVFHPNPN